MIYGKELPKGRLDELNIQKFVRPYTVNIHLGMTRRREIKFRKMRASRFFHFERNL